MENIEDRLERIEEKLDAILEHNKWEKRQWSKSESLESSIKRWGSFYIASLLADETLGRNGK